MGGFGSGRLGFRPIAERSQRLDVRALAQRGLLGHGIHRWVWSLAGQEIGSIVFHAHGDRITLDYRVRTHGGEWEQMLYDVPIVRTPCHYGGSRPWFRCPACWRRVAVLYLPGRMAACRKCYRIGYQSQCDSRAARAMRKMEKIEERLGGDETTLMKPPRMRWATFDRLVAEYEVLEAQSLVPLARLLGLR